MIQYSTVALQYPGLQDRVRDGSSGSATVDRETYVSTISPKLGRLVIVWAGRGGGLVNSCLFSMYSTGTVQRTVLYHIYI